MSRHYFWLLIPCESALEGALGSALDTPHFPAVCVEWNAHQYNVLLQGLKSTRNNYSILINSTHLFLRERGLSLDEASQSIAPRATGTSPNVADAQRIVQHARGS